jgi:CubicO group peptidase (beta-lactamase class C family)
VVIFFERTDMRSATAAITALWVSAGVVAAQPAPLRGLDEYVVGAMRDWKVPGLSIAVVRHDSVVYAHGYGVRRLGAAGPVDERTMFAIGSSSKTFTAGALAILVDEGKLGWDSRVAAVLPGFELADPIASQETTVRDLLSHRTGVPGENVIFWGTALGRDEILRRLRFIPLTARPRTRYQYQNLMFLAAGQIVPARTGRSWDEFVTTRLLRPLGMLRTTTRVADLGRYDNVASPHALRGASLEPIPWLNLDNAGPAGSMVSTAVDMAQWVRLQLGRGTYRRTRLISDTAMAEMHSAQMPIPNELPYSGLMPDAHLRAYGLGWMMHDYHDRLIVEHGGQTDGMHGTVALMPEADLGVVVLTNTVLFGLPAAIMYRVFDAYLGREPQEWAAKIKVSMIPLNGGSGGPVGSPASSGAKPSLPIERYAGVYRHPLYGDATVAARGGALRLELLGMATPLVHRQLDTFATDWATALDREILGSASFFIDARGEPERLIFSNGAEFRRARR